ncbi:ArsR/SmtB family transcription factor [Pendulispora brunnea]|uniref:ArsR/SmtB family transcription factor n=1 Tax=Pendulispora brunnea TaxID=2905690 RepID=UPI00374E0406
MSRHLRILHEAGFVAMRPDGQRRLYSLRPEPFRELDAWLAQYRGLWERGSTASGPPSRKENEHEHAESHFRTDVPSSNRGALGAMDHEGGLRVVVRARRLPCRGAHHRCAPGVPPYENTIEVEFFRQGGHVRMVVALEPLHDAEFTRLSSLGFASQLAKLDKRFAQI